MRIHKRFNRNHIVSEIVSIVVALLLLASEMRPQELDEGEFDGVAHQRVVDRELETVDGEPQFLDERRVGCVRGSDRTDLPFHVDGCQVSNVLGP